MNDVAYVLHFRLCSTAMTVVEAGVGHSPERHPIAYGHSRWVWRTGGGEGDLPLSRHSTDAGPTLGGHYRGHSFDKYDPEVT